MSVQLALPAERLSLRIAGTTADIRVRHIQSDKSAASVGTETIVPRVVFLSVEHVGPTSVSDASSRKVACALVQQEENG